MTQISANSFSTGIQVFRHENPFYDDSYAVNTANVGPYGDAINNELIPYIDETFNTIAAPYGMYSQRLHWPECSQISDFR